MLSRSNGPELRCVRLDLGAKVEAFARADGQDSSRATRMTLADENIALSACMYKEEGHMHVQRKQNHECVRTSDKV